MSQILTTMQQDKNTLIEAYENSRGIECTDRLDLVALYQQHFESKARPIAEMIPIFEKVSLVDPNIKTVLRSTTAVF